MKRLLILGDSLSLPRYKPEVCLFENTWPFLLRLHFDVHQVSIGGGTIADLDRQLEYHIAYEPDYVIIQSGIVDCAPRALGKLELEFLQRVLLTRRFLLPLVKRHSSLIRGIRNIKYTAPVPFKSRLKKIIERFPAGKCFALGILPTSDSYELAVPGITKSVSDYNVILAETFGNNFISIAEIDKEGIMSDFIHLNSNGHKFVYDLVMANLQTHHA